MSVAQQSELSPIHESVASSPDTRSVPEPGQIAMVRGATWAVTDVRVQGLPRSGADDATTGLQHAVTLQSLEEDRLGQELQVVWELEQGRSLRPELGLPTSIDPDRFDDPGRLAAFIDALRWGAITSADSQVVQAPFRSGANVEAYQLEPLRRALRETRANLLLADDVGLGKTIEAGLVAQELFLRHRARTAIIVCPAGLALKWQDEMLEKFGLDFTIINSETMREVRRSHGLHANPFTLFPRIIVSMSWLPGQRAQRLLRDVYAQTAKREGARRFAYDILIVDEAHHVAPSSPQRVDKLNITRRGYAVDSQRTHAVRELAEKCEHRLFLSATPHNGYVESFTALLEMVDPQRFVRGSHIDRSALREVAVRRLKRDLKEAKGFQERQVTALPFEPTPAEEEAYERLLAFTNRRDKAVATGDGAAKQARDMATLLLKKRFFSSPVAFARTVDVYLETRLRGVDAELTGDYDDVLGVDADDLEEGKSDQTEMLTLAGTRRKLPPLTDEDVVDLRWLSRWGHEFDGTVDSRLAALVRHLDGVLLAGDRWLDERIVVFTEYVDTLYWVRDNLLQHGYAADRIAVIDGGTDPEQREITRAQFNEPPSKTMVRILLATDAAGEGIDLQANCHRLFNYDIPFNPNRLEQRIGRVDRYGQDHQPDIRHFTPTAGRSGLASDVDLLARVATKIARVELDLGSANEIIAPDIQRQLTGAALTPRSAAQAPEGDRAINEMLLGQRQVNAELTALETQLAADRESLHLRPMNLRRVVETALDLDMQPRLIPSQLEDGGEVFELPSLARSWEPVTRGLASRLEPDRLRPITFDQDVARATTDFVHAHLGHPLLQRSTRLLRSALWGGETDLNRVSAVVVPALDESFAAAVVRLVLVGRGGIRLHEEVFLAGTRLARRQQVGVERAEELLARALDGVELTAAPDEVARDLAAAWDDDAAGLRSRVEDAIRARVERRTREVEDRLAKRREEDLARVDAIFTRFAGTLRESIAAAEKLEQEAEAMLFDVEQHQSERDLRQMRARLDALDDERRREREAVETRYQDVKPWPFPAAVLFAISPADAEKGVAVR
ncbi:Superfamily II DNA/RNA helicases, SNF2 family [Blastococcus aurantiacus]|uniref:Superfamily II DNA/RNA helicases, SNF2 family n=1 Tax=Blastococcus aurantiacus TaxID=1550231 RepID=A0A1G7I1X5_9ACTN|nr:DISARM system SNF2-like helicase DrmD [Blastococcus aurantiacus]SDF06750.1 Superfamily II DNA/RNA helicases, SNF2 family [Blastococcus aurantiacus]